MRRDAQSWLLEQLWAPIVAVTAAHDGRTNGLICSTALTASLVPEAPRVSVHLAKQNLTHDLVLGSGSLAIHLLPRGDAGLTLFRALGLTSGRAEPKLAGRATRVGATGSPLLVDAVAYVEARVAATLESDELSVVLADVVAAGGAADVPYLTIEDVRTRLPREVLREWERRYEAEVRAARRLRQVSPEEAPPSHDI